MRISVYDILGCLAADSQLVFSLLTNPLRQACHCVKTNCESALAAGMTNDQLVDGYPELTVIDILAALAYRDGWPGEQRWREPA